MIRWLANMSIAPLSLSQLRVDPLFTGVLLCVARPACVVQHVQLCLGGMCPLRLRGVHIREPVSRKFGPCGGAVRLVFRFAPTLAPVRGGGGNRTLCSHIWRPQWKKIAAMCWSTHIKQGIYIIYKLSFFLILRTTIYIYALCNTSNDRIYISYE